jgi:hypothetical protein
MEFFSVFDVFLTQKIFCSGKNPPTFICVETTMAVYAWVKNAYIKGNFLLDHTWVTSYDIYAQQYSSINQVMNANEQYWFSKGDFWSVSRMKRPIVQGVSSGAENCLVGPNNKAASGTIHTYGIDGVCHQVANQVLYAAVGPLTVSAARGYTLSSALYGTYGRNELEWAQARDHCGVKAISPWSRRGITSLLTRRMSYYLQQSIGNALVFDAEQRRRALLRELDDIGFRRQRANETKAMRALELNIAINRFLRDVEQLLPEDRHLMKVLGIERNQEAFVIDSELFEFPEPETRPIRSAVFGW